MAYHTKYPQKKELWKNWRVALLAVVLAFAAAAVVLTSDRLLTPSELQAAAEEIIPQQLTPEELAATGEDFVALVDDEEEPGVHRGVIRSGDTAGAILQAWLSGKEAHSLIASCEGVYSLAKLRAGQPYMVVEDENGFCLLEYEIDKDRKLVVRKDEDEFVAAVQPIEYDVRLERIESEITHSLFLSMTDAGETAALAVRLAEIFAWEINFIRDIQPGDSFSLLVEKRYRDGEFFGYGSLLAAEFINQGSVYDAYVHYDQDGVAGYFNAAGDSLKRAFLKAPLSFTRISSGFNLQRRHPIFNEVRPHPAIDYAAPTGTPVKAIGSGTVVFKGSGKGAGNYVTLKHNNGYESMYLHLNGFAKGLSKGQKVKQGEVIGFVGSTGYATGPHLDFRMKHNGKYVNPDTLLSPREEALTSSTLAEFKVKRDLYRLYLEGSKDLAEYSVERGGLPQ